MKKIFIGIGIFLIILIMILLNLFQGEKTKEVEIEIVKKGEIIETVKLDGRINAYKQVEIGSDVMGRIERILVKERQKIKKGDLLCIINPETYKARLFEIKSRLSSNLSKFNMIKNEYERAKELFLKDLISKSEFEKAESEYLSMKESLKSDSFVLKEAEEDLRKCYIRSPIDGEVLRIDKEEGEMVVVGLNVPGNVIMVVANRETLILEGEVDEGDIVKIEKGDSADVKVTALPEKKFKGIVKSVGGLPTTSSISEGGALFPVRILLLGNDPLLTPGMNASCEIITNKKKDVLILPYSAIGKEKDKYFVFIKSKGKAEKRFISIGIQGKENVEIIEGIVEGDSVIKGPQKVLNLLKEGERVKEKK
ncbi:MAG: efflux RND transporter periplasmic adaptor subunit [candidate division WOR-3 bacterium]